MADQNEQIRKGLLRFLGLDSDQVILGTVESVDKTAFTCHLKRANGFEVPDARLKTLKNAEKGIVLLPKVGSDVLAHDLGGGDWLVISVEEVESMVMHVDNTLVEIGKDLFQLNGGNNGGLTIADKVEGNLTAVKEFLSQMATLIMDGLSSAAAMDATAGTVFKTKFELLNLTFNNMENPKVKH